MSVISIDEIERPVVCTNAYKGKIHSFRPISDPSWHTLYNLKSRSSDRAGFAPTSKMS